MSAARILDAAPRFTAARAAHALAGLTACAARLNEIQAQLAALRADIERAERKRRRPRLVQGGKS